MRPKYNGTRLLFNEFIARKDLWFNTDWAPEFPNVELLIPNPPGAWLEIWKGLGADGPMALFDGARGLPKEY